MAPSRWGPKKTADVSSNSAMASPRGVHGHGRDNDDGAAASDSSWHRNDRGYQVAHDVNIRDEPDFEVIDSILWADDLESDDVDVHNDMLAKKPKPERAGDPCGCTMPQVRDGSVLTCNDEDCVMYCCQEECRGNCEAGEFCGNKRLQRKQWKRLEIFNAGKKGKGLRLLEDAKKGDLITEYVGKAVHKEYLPRLFHRYSNERRLYIMSLDKDIFLDAKQKGGIARYINHSCDPNTVVQRWRVRGLLRNGIFAYKDIPAGTELSFDYQWDRKRGRAPTKCHCGSEKCRGTLEVARSMENEQLERKLCTHWKKPPSSTMGASIINRSIKVFSEASQEYYPADVVNYNPDTKEHLVMYQDNYDEEWTDLSKEDWMILDEEAEQFIIGKKKLSYAGTNSDSKGASAGQEKSLLAGNSNLVRAAEQQKKAYIYVQTPVKDAMFSKHLIERCQRTCGVRIIPQQMARPPLPVNPDDPEDVEKFKALDMSTDGTVWKLNISGGDISKAKTVLERNILFQEKRLSQEATAEGGTAPVVSPHGDGTNADATPVPINPTAEVIIPRAIVDAVKRRLPLLRNECRNVIVTFVPSESKSKQFAKLVLEASLLSDLQVAQDQLWSQLLTACADLNAPRSPSGMFKDLGFLGGELSHLQFQRLIKQQRGDPSPLPSQISNKQLQAGPNDPIVQDAQEDLSSQSPFFSSFEATNRCTIWIQSEHDKGRINASNQRVSEAAPDGTSPRKIYIGCASPSQNVSKLFSRIVARAQDLARGVKYLHLGADRLYQPHMMRNGGLFFQYVERITGAGVAVDDMTGDYLRIDGRGSNSSMISLVHQAVNLTEANRAILAEEIVRLQIEMYRDHCVREQSWVFGRDWTLVQSAIAPKTVGGENNENSNGASASGNVNVTPNSGLLSRAVGRQTLFDAKSLPTACIEIADIASSLNVGGMVGGHAVVILYRFISMLPSVAEIPVLKTREIVLSCVFLANKAQKAKKWKSLDAVLESAYKKFYPGAAFDRNKEEVQVLEEKVLTAEKFVLDTLEYDVFWRGFDWIRRALHIDVISSVVGKDAQHFSLSGPVLAAGSDLWLKYGAEYIFAAACAFMGANVESLCQSLSLIPLKVWQAAELITTSTKFGSIHKKSPAYAMFQNNGKILLEKLPSMKNACIQCMSRGINGGFNSGLSLTSEAEQRYRIIGNRNQERYSFSSVDDGVVKEYVLPSMDGISAESNCSIFLDKSATSSSTDIILEGSWRAIAIATFLLQEAVKKDGKHNLPEIRLVQPQSDQYNKIEARGKPGLLEMKDVETTDGWAGTIQCTSDQWGRKAGGKCCMPAKVQETVLRDVGLRWWIPQRFGPSPTGSICDTFELRQERDKSDDQLSALVRLAKGFLGDDDSFPMLAASINKTSGKNRGQNRCAAVSLQRWPSERIGNKEQGRKDKLSKSKNSKRGDITDNESNKQNLIGFSAAALQEMQLLNMLHKLISSPRGHPNFILPVGVALPSEIDSVTDSSPVPLIATAGGLNFNRGDDDIFSLTRTSEENEIAARKERRRKDMIMGPHLIFEPTPFVLQRFLTRRKRTPIIPPTILAAWFHDLLSALVHCHTNRVLLRKIQPDQIVVDHSGVAKIGGLYRSGIISKEDLKSSSVKFSKNKSDKSDSDDIANDPFVAPEMLLGSQKYTKETDIWSVGCLLAQLLLNKVLFSGKDRQSLLLSMYKIIGTPASSNFGQAAKSPYFFKPPKKYKPGVPKALQHMLKGDGDENNPHAGAIDLLSQMLRLDPKQRISAVEALRHGYVQNFIENCSTSNFRQSFVRDWMSMKQRFVSGSTDDVEQRGTKRKIAEALLSGGGNGSADDELYDVDDLLVAGSGSPSKKLIL